jgi:hypothetical protein
MLLLLSQVRTRVARLACDSCGAGGCVPRISRVTSTGELDVADEVRVK